MTRRGAEGVTISRETASRMRKAGRKATRNTEWGKPPRAWSSLSGMMRSMPLAGSAASLARRAATFDFVAASFLSRRTMAAEPPAPQIMAFQDLIGFLVGAKAERF